MTSPATTLDRETAAPDEGQELRIWLRMLTCVHAIEAAIRARLRAEFDTSLPRFDVLAQLHAAGTELTMGALSARLMVTSGNVTGLVDAMEGDNLVRRRAHPGDRRSTLIAMTPHGQTLFDRMAPAHASWIQSLMATLSATDRTDLLQLLGSLKRSVSGEGGE